MKEKKARVEDALHATRAAVEEGIIPGGGVAFIRSIPALDGVKAKDDVKIGVDIIRRALEEPLRQIAANAGVEGAVIVDEVKKSAGVSVGYNADANKVEDLVAAGVIDPTKVARIALQNASSIAGLLLTTECVIAEKPKEEKPMPMPQGGGGYGDMY